MSKVSPATLGQNCGSCRWIAVEPSKLTKDFRVNKRFHNSVFPCNVPFEMPKFPDSIVVTVNEKRWTCPSYGTTCPFHERRTA